MSALAIPDTTDARVRLLDAACACVATMAHAGPRAAEGLRRQVLTEGRPRAANGAFDLMRWSDAEWLDVAARMAWAHVRATAEGYARRAGHDPATLAAAQAAIDAARDELRALPTIKSRATITAIVRGIVTSAVD